MSNTLNDLRYQLKTKAQQVARRMDTTWQAELRTTAPHRSYQLRNKTTVSHSQNRNSVLWTALVDVPYAEHQAYGTRPHMIFPTRRKMLRFIIPGATFSQGQVVFAAQVHHPGTQPNPWWKTSLENAVGRLQRLWNTV